MIVVAILAGYGLAQGELRGFSEGWKERHEKMEVAMRKLKAASDEVQVWLKKAEVDAEKSKLDEAERKCYVGLRLYPEYAKGSIACDCYNELGKIEMKRGHYARAVDDFFVSLRGGLPEGHFSASGAEDVEIRSNLARCDVKLNKEALAVETAVNLVKEYKYFLYNRVTLDELPSVTDPHSKSVESTIRLLYASMPQSPGTPFHRLEDMLYVVERYPKIYGVHLLLAETYRVKKDYEKARYYICLASNAKGTVKAQLDSVALGVSRDEEKAKH